MENKTIDELALELRRAYYKKWRERNKDKVAQHNRNFWLKRAALAASGQSGKSDDREND